MSEQAACEELKPCPFCGAGTSQIRENTYWTGMRNIVQSVSVMHWCVRPQGHQQNIITIYGKTREEAIEAWNKGAKS